MAGIWNLDPKQRQTLAYYIDPTSKTFGNARQSALKAGYAKITALHITERDWFKEQTKNTKKIDTHKNLLEKAEKNLEKFVELDTTEKRVNLDGTVQVLEGKDDPQLLGIQYKATEFVSRTLGKQFYSEKHEVENKNLNINVQYGDDTELTNRITELERRIIEVESGEVKKIAEAIIIDEPPVPV